MSNTHSENTKRIAKNTMMLYCRMLIGMLISLYTSRVVLNILGIEDYGIYSVVGGVVAMFSVLSGSISAAISRFLTFELGKGDKERLGKVFSTSLVVEVILAIIIFILVETIGFWFLNHRMIIPEERMFAANCLLQFSILSFVVAIVSAPYNASIISHEHMDVFAYIGISDMIVRLLIVLALPYLPTCFDLLISYSAMLLGTTLAFQVVYWVYCRKHFEECRFSLCLEKPMLKEMMGFAGWNFIGASSTVLRDQGCNIILNLFWGPSLNAARGIAQQVSNAICGFVGNFMTALNPQITKSYAAGNTEYLLSLIFRAARFSYYLLLMLSLPVLFNTTYLIQLWLGQVPEHVVLYVRLIIIFSLCETVSNPLVTVMLATGNIRNYQIIVGGLQMMNLPISYMLLKMGFFPEIITVVAIALSICCLIARLVMLQHMIGLSIYAYAKKVLLNLFIVTSFAIIFPAIISFVVDVSFFKFFFSIINCVFSACIAIYLLGCSGGERTFIKEKMFAFLKRFGHL